MPGARAGRPGSAGHHRARLTRRSFCWRTSSLITTSLPGPIYRQANAVVAFGQLAATLRPGGSRTYGRSPSWPLLVVAFRPVPSSLVLRAGAVFFAAVFFAAVFFAGALFAVAFLPAFFQLPSSPLPSSLLSSSLFPSWLGPASRRSPWRWLSPWPRASFRGRPAAAGGVDTGLQRAHEVHHVGRLRCLLGRRHRGTRFLRPDHLVDPVGCTCRGSSPDLHGPVIESISCAAILSSSGRGLVRTADVADLVSRIPDLVGEEHRLEHQQFGVRPDRGEVFLTPHHQ